MVIKVDDTKTTDFYERLKLSIRIRFPEFVVRERKEWPNEVNISLSDLGWQIARKVINEEKTQSQYRLSPLPSTSYDRRIFSPITGLITVAPGKNISDVLTELRIVFLSKTGGLNYFAAKTY